jgi:general secretion pathway protein G
MKRSCGRRRGGFTLIEVLLVLVILVVLASLAVLNITSAQRGANNNAAKSQIGLFETPLDMYRLDCGSYPSSLEALVQPPPDAPAGKWNGPYLKTALPLDPWNNPYQYMCPGQHHPDSYDCWTNSPDGMEIGNW